ncbi:hypothetical protein C4577_03695 [Candidatus Parcubacteria bacterium]|nr:MAG: hypothetical protein C4577_03695 [Candidatus Parcubacteria bacterium]
MRTRKEIIRRLKSLENEQNKVQPPKQDSHQDIKTEPKTNDSLKPVFYHSDVESTSSGNQNFESPPVQNTQKTELKQPVSSQQSEPEDSYWTRKRGYGYSKPASVEDRYPGHFASPSEIIVNYPEVFRPLLQNSKQGRDLVDTILNGDEDAAFALKDVLLDLGSPEAAALLDENHWTEDERMNGLLNWYMDHVEFDPGYMDFIAPSETIEYANQKVNDYLSKYGLSAEKFQEQVEQYMLDNEL